MFGEKEKTVLYMGSDHAGFELKEKLKPFLLEKGYDVSDLGAFNAEPSDYPDIASEVSEKVLERDGSFGILICGSGVGMEMSANRFNGIRAAHINNEVDAQSAREHNNANVITLGARTTDAEKAKVLVDKFLTTPFSAEERHVRRVEKMDHMAKKK